MSSGNLLDTPWKIKNELMRWMTYPYLRLLFLSTAIPWDPSWRFYGIPIIQKHRKSVMRFGPGMNLRSSVSTNPLGPNHPVILCTWEANACIEIGKRFAMTGGTICAANRIVIGDDVAIGANTTVVDTDFHPLDPIKRYEKDAKADTAPVFINDRVFIGMNCLILKGVSIGKFSVIGAGSTVTRDIPSGVIAAGNPAKILREIITP